MPRADTSPWFTVLLDDGTTVTVTKKRIRTMRLRVRFDGTAACSVPLFTPKHAAAAFVTSRADWIKKAIAKVTAQKKSAPAPRTYDAAWKKAALERFTQTAARFLPCFAHHPIPQFTLKGRAMKTLWGSCNRRTNTITLNWQLFAAPQACIDYVVLHEMTHFLHIHHDKAFYTFIAQWMPDYKTRVKTLRALSLVS